MYKFDRLIAANTLAEAWEATQLGSGLHCFVKKAVDSEELTPEYVRKSLERSFQCQQSLSGLLLRSEERRVGKECRL